MFRVQTMCPRPWILIAHGGHVAGQRPRAILAYIDRVDVVDGNVVSFMCRKYPGGKPTKHLIKVKPYEVVHQFHALPDQRPTEGMMDLAKARLSPEVSLDDLFTRQGWVEGGA